MSTKFCKDCKHAFSPDGFDIALMKEPTSSYWRETMLCRHHNATQPDLVTGGFIYMKCSDMRKPRTNACGMNGKWFEPNE